ncbi:hypothetical protein B0H11DRAFT_2375141 [Mycena galericulata]|nr:hypothetical protein B0H11DRAFT_2375141 [Mycena galericulata]
MAFEWVEPGQRRVTRLRSPSTANYDTAQKTHAQKAHDRPRIRSSSPLVPHAPPSPRFASARPPCIPTPHTPHSVSSLPSLARCRSSSQSVDAAFAAMCRCQRMRVWAVSSPEPGAPVCIHCTPSTELSGYHFGRRCGRGKTGERESAVLTKLEPVFLLLLGSGAPWGSRDLVCDAQGSTTAFLGLAAHRMSSISTVSINASIHHPRRSISENSNPLPTPPSSFAFRWTVFLGPI